MKYNGILAIVFKIIYDKRPGKKNTVGDGLDWVGAGTMRKQGIKQQISDFKVSSHLWWVLFQVNHVIQ